MKPLDLLRWCVKLVTPPGGTCLDPFVGSGTTAAAAIFEGFNVVGIDMTPEYVEIATARCEWAKHEIDPYSRPLFIPIAEEAPMQQIGLFGEDAADA